MAKTIQCGDGLGNVSPASKNGIIILGTSCYMEEILHHLGCIKPENT